MSDNQFKAGDIVFLKSGSPAMTVCDQRGDIVHAVMACPHGFVTIGLPPACFRPANIGEVPVDRGSNVDLS